MELQKHIIFKGQSARDALKTLETLHEAESKTLFVVDENEVLVGTITDGDIRRGLLRDREISHPVEEFMNPSFKFLKYYDAGKTRLSDYRKRDIYLLPLVDDGFRIRKIVDLKYMTGILPATAVIMAGGRGSRLSPLTDNIPKPLLKVGSKPIIEHNIDRLTRFGINKFYISVKYLSEQIMDYLKDGSHKKVSITYLEEDKPLGTMGSISLIDEIETDHLLIMNSDIVSDVDFEDFFHYYLEKNADMCIASIPYQVKVPYGVLELNSDKIVSFKEKPTYTYFSNGGMYFMKKHVKSLVPSDKYYDATDLMGSLIARGSNVSHYPILGYWIDIGRHEDYLKIQEDVKHIRL
jgi:dTDP-glucose pyrophosphorylase